jgi:ABC-2 type transport system ATP-binding protein
MTSPAIEVRDLTIHYETMERPAVDGVNFRVEPGEILALLGPNGAGKTSTVETLEGYRRATSGTVSVLGFHPIDDATQLRSRIGVMLQRNGVYLTMGPRDVVRLFADYYGARADDPDALLERVGLASVASTPWRRLSGGEQQRLSLALALVGRPEVAFLDEPTAAIDVTARQTVRSLLREQRDGGVAIVLTTHDLDEAESLADRVVILDQGRVVAAGTPAELTRADASDGVRFSAPEGIDTTTLSAKLGAPVSERVPGSYVATIEPTSQHVAVIAGWLAEHNLALDDLQAGRRPLEDLFVRLTQSAAETERQRADEAARRARRRRGRS